MIKLLRTIRFDQTDDAVFSRGAPPEDFAVSGTIGFANLGPSDLVGKTRQEFANGFLGLPSFGRSTFATVGEGMSSDLDFVRAALVSHCLDVLGAPDEAAALAAADHELAFVADLCADAPINTVFTIRRVLTDAGEIQEELRTIKPPNGEPLHARVWNVEIDDG